MDARSAQTSAPEGIGPSAAASDCGSPLQRETQLCCCGEGRLSTPPPTTTTSCPDAVAEPPYWPSRTVWHTLAEPPSLPSAPAVRYSSCSWASHHPEPATTAPHASTNSPPLWATKPWYATGTTSPGTANTEPDNYGVTTSPGITDFRNSRWQPESPPPNTTSAEDRTLPTHPPGDVKWSGF